MFATTLAKTAYADPSLPTRTARGTEFEVFARVTRRLKQAAAEGETGFPALAAAIYENRKLWAILSDDVSLPENGLPDDLRARLFYLGAFTQDHSRKVLSGKATADILIEINTSIMRGLRQERAAS
ncbi:flagellar biosynthesis regulator FlaF [Thioclava sp. BHET1]|uniref:Flagellar biosynthesis regulator FlhF n=1 Tax=Thioclava dalianensis TaxID=1185766 RepID=A0A074TJQ3_9RHOB|nr:flagellar biosynthesis regulator FlaF [Thioclava dalianensis]KEP70395.1 flagellar biosynthesis regulator FlhF [Thioclava dalianensis]TMV94024.1 flagellar biosynthesis regulator FlaF [Thioclava sp. BHET1]SFN31842.1 flagellar protein FlaF [Thioclava dalianensis]